jgi:sulfoxide reductase heme-binding subunit YedZ
MNKTLIFLFILGTLLLTGSEKVSFVFAENATTNQVTTQEVSKGATVIVDALPESSISKALLERGKKTWPWYVTRASGLVAGFLLTLLLMSGSGFITGHTFRFLEPITAWATHRALGLALGFSVLIHIVTLYFDSFVNFDVASLLVPFFSDYKSIALFGVSVGSLYVALGVLALYIFLAVILTSLFWIDKKPKTWKLIHILSYIGMVFVFVHALYLGTDLAQGVLRFVWIILGVLVTITTLLRLWRVKTV